MIDVFTMSSSGLPDGTHVVGFRGSEAISTPYAFEIYLTIPSDETHAFELEDGVGSRATLTIDRQDGRPPFAFHGVFSELSLVHEMGGRALVRALLVPQLWRLSQTFHSRIFTQMSIPAIIEAILEDGGFGPDDYVFKLAGKYEVEEHVCQYRESHLDFIARWMEREGLYYYFEQGDSSEKLIITDSKSFQSALVSTPVRFRALAGSDATAKECLESFVCRRRSLPGTVKFKDHDYTRPALGVSASAPVSKAGLGEISVHGARFFSPESGKRLVQLRAEELLARELLFTGAGTSFFLRAGYTFQLEDHPRASFDAPYLAVEVEHTGNQAATTAELRRLTGLDTDEVYRVGVTAIPASVQFRGEQKTPWPRVYGTEYGVIDGDVESEYAQLDEHGRYLVRFAFDESDLQDGKASTRVRMMQPHGGGVEGWHFPLRKGTEVLFTFLGGDPDRPVIAGVVPNALTPSPVTRGNQTTNVIQTGGKNRFELEDKAGSERITLKTPYDNSMIRMGAPNDEHNMIIRTDGATVLHAGGDWDVHVGGNLKEYVAGTTNETYNGDHTTQSWANRTIEIGGTYKQNCHGMVVRDVGGLTLETLGGSWIRKVGGDVADYVSGSVVTKCGGTQDNSIGIDWIATAGGEIKITSGAAITITSPSTITLDAPGVESKASGTWRKLTGFSAELFGAKEALGGQKFDGTGVTIAVTGSKNEATGSAVAAIGNKKEATGVAMSVVGLKIDVVGTKISTGTEIKDGPIHAACFGASSVLAGLFKIG